MAEQLEIVFTERGGAGVTPQSQPSAPDEHSQPQGRAPGPADKVTGPKKPDSTAGRDIENAVLKVANVLGVGGLTGTAIQLRRAFTDLFESVTASAKAVDANRRADAGGGSPSAEIKGPPKSSEIPKPGDVAAPPITAKPPGPRIPNVGTFERQAAKGDIAGPPVTQAVRGPVPNVGWFERMTAAKGGATAPPVVGSGIPGPAVAAPVTGPAVGAGTAASGMARLAAIAGPAALAVAALTAGVVAGALVVKKAFDVMNSEATRLAGLSGSLSASTSLNAVRAEFADIRRASRIGPQLANVNNASGQVSAKMADVVTELLKVVVDATNSFQPLVPVLVNTLDLLAAGIPVISDAVVAVHQFLTGDFAAAKNFDEKEQANLKRLVESIGALIRNEIEDKKNKEEDIFAGYFLGNFGERPGAKPKPPRAPPKPKAPVRFGNPVGGFVRP